MQLRQNMFGQQLAWLGQAVYPALKFCIANIGTHITCHLFDLVIRTKMAIGCGIDGGIDVLGLRIGACG